VAIPVDDISAAFKLRSADVALCHARRVDCSLGEAICDSLHGNRRADEDRAADRSESEETRIEGTVVGNEKLGWSPGP
jgi:hypothetical protein